MTELDKRLVESAARASKKAIEKAFDAGLSFAVLRESRVVKVAPDGSEKLIGVQEDD